MKKQKSIRNRPLILCIHPMARLAVPNHGESKHERNPRWRMFEWRDGHLRSVILLSGELRGCSRRRTANRCPVVLFFGFIKIPHILSITESPATLPVVLDWPLPKPFSPGDRRSWTATFGTCGTGSFLCVPSVLDMISLILRPLARGFGTTGVWAWYWPSKCWGSIGARAGVCWRVKLRIPGKS